MRHISKFHSEHTYYQHLINSFYEVKTSEDDNRQISKLSRRIEKSINSSSKQGGSLNGQPAAVLKDAEKEKPSYTKNKRILNLKFIDKNYTSLDIDNTISKVDEGYILSYLDLDTLTLQFHKL